MKTTLLALLAAIALSSQAAEPAKPKWQEAKELLDEHFDDAAVLTAAAKILVTAKSETPNDPNLYVQAARLTIKGREVFQTSLRPGSVEAYADLLERALKLDPSHKKALILRAEAYSIVGDLARERTTLERATRAPGTDRWLQIGWARYSESVKDSSLELHYYSQIEKLGPGETADQRNAFVYALGQIASFRPRPGEPFRLKELAELASKHKSPKDFGTPATFASHFVFHGLYAEAIEYSRASLQIRESTDAALALSAALMGAAALRLADGDRPGAKRLADEAKSLRVPRARLLQRLSGPSANFSRALPHIEALLQ